jgi:PAS domain S-box-containing protein
VVNPDDIIPKLGELFQISPIATAISTAVNGEFLVINDSFVEFAGYQRHEVIGKTSSQLNLFAEISQREEALSLLQDQGVLQDFLVKIVTKEGVEKHGLFSIRSIQLDNESFLITMVQDISKREELKKRDEFLLTILRHDLTNKIHLALGYLELLKDKTELIANEQELLVKTYFVVQETHRFLEKIIKLREIAQEPDMYLIQLNQIINNVMARNNFIAIREKISLKYPETDLLVWGSTLLEELFHNIVENALKHAMCKNITFNIKKEGSNAIIDIEDDGKGISPELQKTMFLKAYDKKSGDSHGLGTYIIKEIAEGYGGSVSVSQVTTGGTRVTVKLKVVE